MTAGGIAGLGLLVVGLSGAIVYEIAGRQSPPASLVGEPARLPSGGKGGSAAPQLSDVDGKLNEILARPVFSPGRRPTGTGSHSVPGLARLTGIVVTGSRKMAIFAGQAGGKPIVVEEGAHINAYELKAISESNVTVLGPEGTTVMTPIFDPSPQVPPRRTLSEPARAAPKSVPNNGRS
ncbi:MAG TPA: hypothetical protein VGF36_14560 [Rhodopila sp.]